MEVREVVNGLLQRGLKMEVKSGVLYVGPRDQMSEETREIVKEYTPGLLAFMVCCDDEEVQWRIAAMLEQLLDLTWPAPIPTLMAAPDAEAGQSDCKSCGELLATGEGDSYICGPCSQAKDLALSLWMQRPARQEKVA